MTEKFTPGVWDWYVTDGGDGYPAIFSLRMDDDVANLCIVNTDYEQSFANAALIAAAPEMYRMLKYLADGIRWGGLQHTDRSLAAEIEAVLKKARGEE